MKQKIWWSGEPLQRSASCPTLTGPSPSTVTGDRPSEMPRRTPSHQGIIDMTFHSPLSIEPVIEVSGSVHGQDGGRPASGLFYMSQVMDDEKEYPGCKAKLDLEIDHSVSGSVHGQDGGRPASGLFYMSQVMDDEKEYPGCKAKLDPEIEHSAAFCGAQCRDAFDDDKRRERLAPVSQTLLSDLRAVLRRANADGTLDTALKEAALDHCPTTTYSDSVAEADVDMVSSESKWIDWIAEATPPRQRG